MAIGLPSSMDGARRFYCRGCGFESCGMRHPPSVPFAVSLPELVPGPRPNGTIIGAEPIKADTHTDRTMSYETIRLDDGRVVVVRQQRSPCLLAGSDRRTLCFRGRLRRAL